MSGAPDRCAAPLAASATEIGLQAGAATLPAISVREAGVGGDETIPARFEPIKLATGCENVVSEDGDVAQRPCEQRGDDLFRRSEEHTSELQSLMRTSYAVFCLKK